MTTTYVSETVARYAREMLASHIAEERQWWCQACQRQRLGQIAAGKCAPAMLAARVLAAYEQYQAARLPRVTFTSHGRLWPSQT